MNALAQLKSNLSGMFFVRLSTRASLLVPDETQPNIASVRKAERLPSVIAGNVQLRITDMM